MSTLASFRPPLQVYYSADYALARGLETVTKSRLLAELVAAGEAGPTKLLPPRLATEAELLSVHSPKYVEDVLTGRTHSLEIGTWSPEALRSVLASTGGMRDAAFAALRLGRSGSFSSGLHHAKAAYGEGFCTINGLAVAAVAALEKVAKVGILDLDAHFGGGTAAILQHAKRVVLVDVSVNSYDRWQPLDKARHRVELVTDPGQYLATVECVLPLLAGCDLILYNAGMDVHEHAGGLKGITTEMVRERERLVVAYASAHRIPIAFALAGGYKWGGLTLKAVAHLHLETVQAFAAA